jgi:hypothetical protein
LRLTSREAASRRMTRATAARRPAVDLSARPNSPAKGSQFKSATSRRSEPARTDVSADEFALVDLGAPSLGPAPDPRNRHALTGACNTVHAADGGGRLTRSRLVRFGRRAPSTNANDAAGHQPTGGYSAVLFAAARACPHQGFRAGKCPCARRGRCRRAHRSPNAAGEPRPRTIVEEQVLRHDTATEP